MPAWVKWLVTGASAIQIFWFLEVLVYAPYRPPADMTSFLRSDGIIVCRVLQLPCAIAVAAAGSHLIGAWRRRRPRAA